ncbi:MAG: hypothetical protein E7553_06340 [Ruminococcaceae bacterium]|nr:hypothetical protein [Oscillospiraceae bacterium]
MKKTLSVLLCIIFILCLSGCTYDPPDGWTKIHHTYAEVLSFARTIDPNATVSEEYNDTVDEYDWEFREWDAIINGVECHMASVSDWVWNSGFLAGEFVKTYYRIDTDYDYLLLQEIVSGKQPNWDMKYDDIGQRYNCNDVISVEIATTEKNALSDNELELVWQDVLEIAAEYNARTVRKKPYFSLSAPGKYYDSSKKEYFVKTDANVIIHDLSDQGKTDFFQEYHEAWALLDSGLQID